MSMISAQIDGLRELAGDGSMEWVTGPIRASVLRDAADTIWQLRDDLQRTNAEADKLREELAIREASEQEKVIEYLRQENIDWEDKYRALAAENAKLLELVRFIIHQCNEGNPRCNECTRWNDGECVALLRMRELGVEA